jgi:chromosome partitioning protein
MKVHKERRSLVGLFNSHKKDKKNASKFTALEATEENSNADLAYKETTSQSDGVEEDVTFYQEDQEEVPVDDETLDDDSYSDQDKTVVNDEDNESSADSEDGITVTPIKTYDQKKPVTHVIGSTQVFAIINQKGGVGKSTTAINLSAALGAMNKQVLLIDLDPQGNSTSGLGIDKSQIPHDVYDVLLDELSIKEAIIPDVTKGLDVLPATINLAGAEVELVNEMARENRLKQSIGEIRGLYDYVLIDCPPSLGLLTVNALVGADKLLIPIQCEFYALEGVTKLLDSMKRVKNMLNPSLDIFGVLLTMYDSRTTLSHQVADEVRKFFKKTVFTTVIPRTVKLSEAPSYGQPITEYDPKGKGAQAYLSLAEEVISRG